MLNLIIICRIFYTPNVDGPLSFKIFCSIQHMPKYLIMCVNALSHSIKPHITYYIINHEHILNSESVTHIYLDKVI